MPGGPWTDRGRRYDQWIEPTTPRVISRLILPLYLPVLFVMIGTGMLIPVLPLYLREVGLSYTAVSTVLAALGAGALIAQLPMGAFVSRVGERTVMLVAHLVIGASIALLGVVSVTITLVSLRAIAGVGSTAWLLSRHSFLTTRVDPRIRGRVSSTFGGVIRVGHLVGPVLGGLIANRWGFTFAFAVIGIITAVGIVPLLVAPRPEPSAPTARSALLDVLRERWRGLVAAGMVQFGFIAVRSGRFALIPFLGAAVGMDVGEVGLLVAAGSGAELLLVPTAGHLMDRHGRLAALVPSLSLFGVGLLMAGAAQSAASLVIAGLVIGVGNGLGAGTMLTIGSDLAPQDDPSGFLSVMGMMRESGRILGPLLVGWFADSLGLAASAVALAVVAFMTAVFTVRVLGDTRAN